MTGTEFGRDELSDPYRFRRGWSDNARLNASQQVRDGVQQGSDLLEVAANAAEIIREILVATRVSITLFQGDDYRDLVHVGVLDDDQVRFPAQQIYPTSAYPETTSRLLARQGYISTSSDLAVVREYNALSAASTGGCFMGVPIAASGEVLGELFALRCPKAPPFTSEDQEIATDFATQLGSRLPELLAARRANDPDW